MTDTDTENIPSHKEKKLKSYNIQFRLDAIKFAEENSNHSAPRKFGVAVNRIPRFRNHNATDNGNIDFRFF